MSIGFQLSEALPIKEGFNHLGRKGYLDPEIEAIKDPTAASDSYEITSVPSPYARWHLFDQAFAWIAKEARDTNGQALEGDTIYHKLVAEALDIGEIIFARKAINARGDHSIEVKSMPFADEVQRLKDSSDPGERNLGETYDLFSSLKKDEGTYINLYDSREIHLLLIDGVPVGGTSPLSLYFTGVDDLSQFSFKLDRTEMFKYPHESLLGRGQAFILAQISMVKDFRTAISRNMPGFTAYVDYVSEQLTTRSDLNKYNEDLVNKYVDRQFRADTLSILDGSNGQVYLYSPEAVGVDTSDLILGTLNDMPPSTEDKRPLVLLPGYRQTAFYYNKVKWDASKTLSSHKGSPEDHLQRTLPGQFVKYPWVTTSDFLEPTILRLTGPLNEQRFLGNPGHKHGRNLEDESGDYLLPLKPLLFRYFSKDEIFGEIQGRKVLEMKRSSDDRSVTVVLRLPIGMGNQFVEISRTYTKDIIPDEAANTGNVIQLKLDVALVPDVTVAKYKEGQIILQETRQSEYPISLIPYASWEQENGQLLTQVTSYQDEIVRVNPEASLNQNTTVYHPSERFDMIRLDADKAGGWLILKEVPKGDGSVSKEFDVAIDFGTTNTHVEIRDRSQGGGQYEAFSLSEPSKVMQTLYPYHLQLKVAGISTVLRQRSFYHEIGPDKKYSFPVRTAIAESAPFNGPEVTPISRKNIPFYYLNQQSPSPDNIYTDLKWSDLTQVDEKSRLNHFISATLQLVAHEVVARGGDLERVRLVYFFPSSMTPFRQGELAEAWKGAYAKFFGNAGGYVQALSESVAPYQYFAIAKKGTWKEERTVNCDIGGGTCDAYIDYEGKSNTPRIASFRFAGRAVFGDGYDTHKGKENGFVKACEDAVISALTSGNSTDHLKTLEAYQQLMNRSISSEEVISFYLSLANRDLHKEVYFDFNQHISLHKPQLRLVYLLYFGAVIYHLLEVTKSMGLERPTDITFTGNGSKILKALGSDSILSTLAGFLADGVYETVQDGVPPAKIRLTTFDNPKDYTCKGGLAMLTKADDLQTEHESPANVVVLGIDENQSGKDTYYLGDNGLVVGNAPTYSDIKQDEDGVYRTKTIAKVERFIDLLFDINKRYSFKSSLRIEINNWEEAKRILKMNLNKGFTNGLNEQATPGNKEQPARETLFFYPLTNALYSIGQELANKKI